MHTQVLVAVTTQEIMQHLSAFAWIILLRTISSKIIHDVTSENIFFIIQLLGNAGKSHGQAFWDLGFLSFIFLIVMFLVSIELYQFLFS